MRNLIRPPGSPAAHFAKPVMGLDQASMMAGLRQGRSGTIGYAPHAPHHDEPEVVDNFRGHNPGIRPRAAEKPVVSGGDLKDKFTN